MSGVILRVVRSAVVTALAAWWASIQNDPKWLAAIPIVHGAFKWLRDRFPNNEFLTYFPF